MEPPSPPVQKKVGQIARGVLWEVVLGSEEGQKTKEASSRENWANPRSLFSSPKGFLHPLPRPLLYAFVPCLPFPSLRGRGKLLQNKKRKRKKGGHRIIHFPVTPTPPSSLRPVCSRGSFCFIFLLPDFSPLIFCSRLFQIGQKNLREHPPPSIHPEL